MMFKHYLPRPTLPELLLLQDISREHPKDFDLNIQELNLGGHIATWQTESEQFYKYVLYMLEKLRKGQEQVEHLYSLIQ